MKIVPLRLREANDFVDRWHRHSCRTAKDGGKFAIGLEYSDKLVGVAIVGVPVARLLANDKGAAELLRLCTSPDAPKGAGSKLYARARRIWQLMGGTKLHTYTLSKESGASMRGAGLTSGKDIRSHTWDMPGRRREHKPIYDEPKQRWTEELEPVKP